MLYTFMAACAFGFVNMKETVVYQEAIEKWSENICLNECAGPTFDAYDRTMFPYLCCNERNKLFHCEHLAVGYFCGINVKARQAYVCVWHLHGESGIKCQLILL